jgi:predicted N-acetyltransferase YhbS
VSIEIRPERPEDRDRSLEIEQLAFGSDEEVAIVEGVRDEAGSFALVAELDGELVGHVQLSRAWIARTLCSRSARSGCYRTTRDRESGPP